MSKAADAMAGALADCGDRAHLPKFARGRTLKWRRYLSQGRLSFWSSAQMKSGPKLTRMAIQVDGGPAPGINGVIAAATIEALHHQVEVFGMRDGNQWIMKGVEPLIKLSGFEPSRVPDFHAWVKAGHCKFIKPLEMDNVIYIPFKGG